MAIEPKHAGPIHRRENVPEPLPTVALKLYDVLERLQFAFRPLKVFLTQLDSEELLEMITQEVRRTAFVRAGLNKDRASIKGGVGFQYDLFDGGWCGHEAPLAIPAAHLAVFAAQAGTNKGGTKYAKRILDFLPLKRTSDVLEYSFYHKTESSVA